MLCSQMQCAKVTHSGSLPHRGLQQLIPEYFSNVEVYIPSGLIGRGGDCDVMRMCGVVNASASGDIQIRRPAQASNQSPRWWCSPQHCLLISVVVQFCKSCVCLASKASANAPFVRDLVSELLLKASASCHFFWHPETCLDSLEAVAHHHDDDCKFYALPD